MPSSTTKGVSISGSHSNTRSSVVWDTETRNENDTYELVEWSQINSFQVSFPFAASGSMDWNIYSTEKDQKMILIEV